MNDTGAGFALGVIVGVIAMVITIAAVDTARMSRAGNAFVEGLCLFMHRCHR